MLARTSTGQLTRRRGEFFALLVLAMALTTIILAAGPAGAGGGGTTLHLYAKTSAKGIYTASGQQITDPNAQTMPGDVFVNLGHVYMGTATKHSAKAAGAYKVTCVLTTSTGNSTCNAKVTVGGSSFLSKDVPVNLPGNEPVRITGGTGRYKKAQGFISSRPVPNSTDNDLTITYTR